MANKEHVELIKKGVEAWNAWRLEDPNILPDLTAANLSKAVLSGANLNGGDFTEADLGDPNPRQAPVGPL